MSGFQTDLLTGLAAFIEDATLGTYSTEEVYDSDETGICLRTMPQSPDRVIVLSTYPISDDPSLSNSELGLQVRCRWEGQDPTPTDDLADALFALLHNLTHTTLDTGVVIIQCLRLGGGSLGQDENGRWENSQNFSLKVHYPSTNRT